MICRFESYFKSSKLLKSKHILLFLYSYVQQLSSWRLNCKEGFLLRVPVIFYIEFLLAKQLGYKCMHSLSAKNLLNSYESRRRQCFSCCLCLLYKLHSKKYCLICPGPVTAENRGMVWAPYPIICYDRPCIKFILFLATTNFSSNLPQAHN